jgi:monoamine oxidase/plastocyanin
MKEGVKYFCRYYYIPAFMPLVLGILTMTPHAFAETIHVTINDCKPTNPINCFVPNILNITSGDTVIWTNNGNFGHTVTSGLITDNQTGTVWDSKLIKIGGDYSFTFQNVGTYNYLCMVHPWMTGKIIVGQGVAYNHPTHPAPPPLPLTPSKIGSSYCPLQADEKYCYKVIIIGAGMAGLGAAVELETHGYDSANAFVILESSPTPGGRVDTETCKVVPGSTICNYNKTSTGKTVFYDTHASMISGTAGNPITQLAHKYNVNYTSTDYSNATYSDEHGLITNQTRIGYLSGLDSTFVSYYKAERQKIIQNNLPDESLQTVMDAYIKNQTLTPDQTKDFLFGISDNIGNEWAADPSDLSLFYNVTGYRVGGDNPDVTDSVFTDGGFGQVVNGLITNVGNNKIQYNTTVTQVNYTDQGVTVATRNDTGQTNYYYGKYVISTIPLNVLHNLSNKTVQFYPNLNQNKVNSINRMLPMGTLGQTYIYFRNETLLNNLPQWLYYVPLLDKTGHWTVFENMYLVNKQPILLGFNYGKFAINVTTHLLDNNGNNTYMQELIPILQDITSSKQVTIHTIAIVYPGESPSYSTNPVGLKVPDDFNQLASPLTSDNGTNRVFFAGEATTWHYPATTTGAFLSGLREANRVQVTDTGNYPSPSWQEKNWRYPAWSNDDYSSWATFPEYIICKPPLMVALENNASPICVKNDTAQKLFQRGVVIDPSIADPSLP